MSKGCSGPEARSGVIVGCMTTLTETTPDRGVSATDKPLHLGRRRAQLQSSVVVITGGGRGIGRLVASALAEAGAAVGLVARSSSELEETVTLIERAGG